jgi:hypothetical protein
MLMSRNYHYHVFVERLALPNQSYRNLLRLAQSSCQHPNTTFTVVPVRPHPVGRNLARAHVSHVLHVRRRRATVRLTG